MVLMLMFPPFPPLPATGHALFGYNDGAPIAVITPSGDTSSLSLTSRLIVPAFPPLYGENLNVLTAAMVPDTNRFLVLMFSVPPFATSNGACSVLVLIIECGSSVRVSNVYVTPLCAKYASLFRIVHTLPHCAKSGSAAAARGVATRAKSAIKSKFFQFITITTNIILLSSSYNLEIPLFKKVTIEQ